MSTQENEDNTLVLYEEPIEQEEPVHREEPEVHPYRSTHAVWNTICSMETDAFSRERASWLRIFQAYDYVRQIYIRVARDPDPYARLNQHILGWSATLWTLGSSYHARRFAHFGRFDVRRIHEYARAIIDFLVDEGRELLVIDFADEVNELDGMRQEIRQDFANMFQWGFDAGWNHFQKN